MVNLVKYRLLSDTIHNGRFYARGSVIELAEENVDNINFEKLNENDRSATTQSAVVKGVVKK